MIENGKYGKSGKLAGYITYTYDSSKTAKAFAFVDDDAEESRTQNVTFYDADNRIEKEGYPLYDKETSKFVLDTLYYLRI